MSPAGSLMAKMSVHQRSYGKTMLFDTLSVDGLIILFECDPDILPLSHTGIHSLVLHRRHLQNRGEVHMCEILSVTTCPQQQSVAFHLPQRQKPGKASEATSTRTNVFFMIFLLYCGKVSKFFHPFAYNHLKISTVIPILQENRTFLNLFHYLKLFALCCNFQNHDMIQHESKHIYHNR